MLLEQVKSISKDETELETLSMSLDGSAYPSTLSIDPSAQASLSLTAGGSTQQSHGTHAVIHAKSEKSQRISSKRQRNDSDEVVKREDVVDLDAIPDSLAKTVASPEVRASKRTRGGGLGVAAHTPAPPAPAPAAAVAAAASDLVSPAVMAKGLDGKGAAAASQLEADQATQASPATTRRQRDTDKLRTTLREGMENKKSRNRAAPQPPHPEKAAAGLAPPHFKLISLLIFSVT